MSVSVPSTAPDRPTRFLARVDAAVPTLANDDARLIFLKTEYEKWEQRFLVFQDQARFEDWSPTGAAIDGREETVNDYVLVLTGLASRIAAIEARA